MNKKIFTLISILVLALAFFSTSCQKQDPHKKTPPPKKTQEKPEITTLDDSAATPEDIQTHINANNQFALEFYQQIKDQDDQNIFFSPYSISTALSMTYEGAKNETASQMESVFHFSNESSSRRSANAAIYNLLNPQNADYQLSTANALWIQEDFQILNDYTDTVKNFYGGEATNVDFITNLEETRQQINKWVEDQTNNKIKDLFPEGSLKDLTRLVLTNAVYFKGDWKYQFDQENTTDQDFYLSEQETIQVPLMKQTDSDLDFNYTENDSLQILELPYKGDDLSMLVLLPKENLKNLEAEINNENLNQWKESMYQQNVHIYLPKFTFEKKYRLNDTLKEMGMTSAFIEPSQPDGADFSGITGAKDLFIDLIVHQAFVEVNEEGTEAAAATGVAMTMEAAMDEPIIFKADHPFIFIIQEAKNGNILFMGRVNNPISE